MNKIVLLTGFLGAGKTTFLNHILQEFADAKIGLIVNEFSKTGVDGALIRKDIPGADMMELTNGSIFCACIKDSFVNALIHMGKQDFEYVFVEASGLADPSSILSILEQIRAFSGVEYDYQGAVCLVDALTFPKHSKVLVSLQRQVIHSRAAILNKTDLADEEAIRQTEEAIRELNPDIPIFHTSYARISLREILEEKGPEAPAPQESTNTEQTRLMTLTLRTKEAADLGKLRTFLEKIAPFTYRIKGFCLTTEGVKNVSMVETVCRVEDWEEPIEETQLVIISSVGVKVVSETLEAAKDCFKEQIKLR